MKQKQKVEYILSFIRIPDFGVRKIFSLGRDFFSDFLWHLHDHFIPHARNNYRPHVFSQRALALFSALLVTVKVFILATMAFGSVLPAFSSAITLQNVIALTNQSRQEYTESALSESSVLDRAAQAKADDMLVRGYFSHNTPDGKTPWSFIQAAGYNYLEAGENLAVNFNQAEDVEAAWMNSPEHKANILNRDFEQIGIGISQGEFQGHQAIIVVQMFGVPAEQKIELTDQPTPVQTQKVPPPHNAAVPPVLAAAPSSALPAPEPASNLNSAPPLALSDPNVQLSGSVLQVSVKATAAVKVLAVFGQQAVMLQPKTDNIWQGEIPLGTLAQNNSTVRLQAFDISGNMRQTQLAYFSGSAPANFNILGASSSQKISVFGQVFSPQALQQNFYLLFIACMLVSLVLAIAIRRHVQHLDLVANGSFVVILACLLWLGG